MRWPSPPALVRRRQALETSPELRRFRDRRRRARLLLAFEFGAVTLDQIKHAYRAGDRYELADLAHIVTVAKKETRVNPSPEDRQRRIYRKGVRRYRADKEHFQDEDSADWRERFRAYSEKAEHEYWANLAEVQSELFSDSPWSA